MRSGATLYTWVSLVIVPILYMPAYICAYMIGKFDRKNRTGRNVYRMKREVNHY